MARGRRRTKEEILREKRTQWISWGQDWYAQYQACNECGNMAYCKGKTSANMKCEYCHFGIPREEELATTNK